MVEMVGPVCTCTRRCRAPPMWNARLYLKHTEAHVNRPRSFRHLSLWLKFLSLAGVQGDLITTHVVVRLRPLGVLRSHADDARFEEYGRCTDGSIWARDGRGENRTRFFDISVRMNHKRRKIEVRRQNILEMLSEISGSWEPPSSSAGWSSSSSTTRSRPRTPARDRAKKRKTCGQERAVGALLAPLQGLPRPRRRRRRQRPSRRRRQRQRPRRRRRHQRPRPRYLPRLPPRRGGSSWR